MRITALSGGVGGARFLRGLLDHLDADDQPAELTVIGNTGDDITMHGLRICPDLDTLCYTLGGVADEEQGWGLAGESHVVQGELSAYGEGPDWFSLGDKDIATHIMRSHRLGRGQSLSEVTAAIADRFGLGERGVRLLPMSDDLVETHVVVDEGAGPAAIHFQQWWVRHQAALSAQRFVVVGGEQARPAPGVLDAIRSADIVLLPPSNPVVSIGIILAIPGIREALNETSAPVVGVSPIIDGRPVRGHADACLAALGVPTTAASVAGLYADFLDGWLIADDEAWGPMAAGVPAPAQRLRLVRGPLVMSNREDAAELAALALSVAVDLGGAPR